MSEPDDHQLLAEFAGANSEAAFATIVGRYVNLVYSTAFRFTRNPHHSEEITQVVFIILARKAGKLSSSVLLSGWLYQTTRLTAGNFMKSEIRRQRREQEAYMQSALNEPDDVVWNEIAPLLDEAMGKLGETDRNAVVLRFFENKTAAEVAAKLKLTEAASHKRVSRALEKLHKLFTMRGVTSTTDAMTKAISVNSVQIAPAVLAKTVTAVAIAKGATASLSTATLIKGALKIMAWTKMKSAIIVGAAIILVAGTTTVVKKHISNRYEDLFTHMDSAHLKTAPPALILRPSRYADRGNLAIGGAPEAPGKFIGRGRPVEYLLCDAYGVTPQRMVLPNGLSTGKFDFLATLPNDPKAALREAIKNQLGLIGHIETQEQDVLVVRVVRSAASGLRISQGSEASVYSNLGKFTATNFKMSNPDGTPGVVDCLGLLFGLPMVDETGLTNAYDFELRWNGNFDIPKSDDQKKQVEHALLDQLGFELIRNRRPVEILIVEKAR